MDELDQPQTMTAGERLRAARLEQGLHLEDIAAQTRIPQRHLEALEEGAWDRLPAPTYTIGFARSYATCLSLDRAEISDQLRAEMGGSRPVSTAPEVFQPADPARTMPKWLVFGAIAGVILVVLALTWLNNRSLEQPQVETDAAAPVAAAPAPQPQPAPAAAAQGPVVLTASEPVWLQVYERGGATIRQGELKAGERFEIPATASAPLLRTGKPEALRITVGSAAAPPVGPPATTVRDVSLLPADLMRGGNAQLPAAPASPPAR